MPVLGVEMKGVRKWLIFKVDLSSALRIFRRNLLKLDKDLIISGSVENLEVYRSAKSKKI